MGKSTSPRRCWSSGDRSWQSAEVTARVHALQLAVDEKKLEVIGARVSFSKEMLDKQNADMEAKGSRAQTQSRFTAIRFQAGERRWMTARTTVDSTGIPGPEMIERVDTLKAIQPTPAGVVGHQSAAAAVAHDSHRLGTPISGQRWQCDPRRATKMVG